MAKKPTVGADGLYTTLILATEDIAEKLADLYRLEYRTVRVEPQGNGWVVKYGGKKG